MNPALRIVGENEGGGAAVPVACANGAAIMFNRTETHVRIAFGTFGRRASQWFELSPSHAKGLGLMLVDLSREISGKNDASATD